MAVVAAAPARIPLHAGGQQANLLVPLYGVLIAIALAHAYTLAVGREQRPQMGLVGWTMAALIGWSAISLLWSADSHQGGVQMLFFYLPFGYLATRIVALRPTLRQLRLMLYTEVALALVFAAVAFWQYESRHLFWNQKIIVSNQYASFFRVNSLFYDASVYGRFMAVTIVLLAGGGGLPPGDAAAAGADGAAVPGPVPVLLAVQPDGAGGRRPADRRHDLAAAAAGGPGRRGGAGRGGRAAGLVARQLHQAGDKRSFGAALRRLARDQAPPDRRRRAGRLRPRGAGRQRPPGPHAHRPPRTRRR